MEAHGKGAIYCRAFFEQAHGKGTVCRAFLSQAHGKQPMFVVRFSGRRTAKSLCLPCAGSKTHGKGCPTPFGAGAVSCFFFAVRLGKTHGKDCLTCVVRRGAWQRGFTVQNATVRPLPCALTKNARQKVCRAFLGLRGFP
jgi:hypothetical protein